MVRLTDKKLRKYFSKLGKKSVEARMQNLTPERRTKIAKAAAKARWAQKKGGA
jgi:hypothetical protein